MAGPTPGQSFSPDGEQISRLGGGDLDALALELGELKALDFDLRLTGFDTREIDAFTLTPNVAEDAVPPLPEVPASRATAQRAEALSGWSRTHPTAWTTIQSGVPKPV
jgi:hypothetical protein